MRLELRNRGFLERRNDNVVFIYWIIFIADGREAICDGFCLLLVRQVTDLIYLDNVGLALVIVGDPLQFGVPLATPGCNDIINCILLEILLCFQNFILILFYKCIIVL